LIILTEAYILTSLKIQNFRTFRHLQIERLSHVNLKQPNKPVVGFWLMPENTIPGMLENFVQLLVPEGDSLWTLANDSLQRIPKQEQRFIDAHRVKAHIHTWLAWQEEPGMPMGLAITKRYFKGDAPEAQKLIAWIQQLFF
jgi:hypothetical protein